MDPTRTQQDVAAVSAARPVLPADVEEEFIACRHRPEASQQLIYRAALHAQMRLHFVRVTYKIDHWEDRNLLALLAEEVPSVIWEGAVAIGSAPLPANPEPEPGAQFAPIPAELHNPRTVAKWSRQLPTHCYRTERLDVWKCTPLKTYSRAGESLREFRIRVAQLARQKRDLEVEKLRRRYATKIASLERRIDTAVDRLQREKAEYQKASIDSAVSVGSSLLGALVGRKLASRTNLRRASSSARRVSAAAKQRSDVAAARAKLTSAQRELGEMEAELGRAIDALGVSLDPAHLPIEPIPLKPRKSDIEVTRLVVAWTPWYVDAAGGAQRAFA